MTSANNSASRCFSILLKPCGAACNLNCRYCYYTHRPSGAATEFMTEALLERGIREIFAVHGSDATVEFNWHGGEPLLRGLEFFQKAVALQQQYGGNRKTRNTLQTNGILLNEAWCGFFQKHNFLIGLSLDGPGALHDNYRRSHTDAGSFDDAMRGLELLKQHRVEFNILAAIHAGNVKFPLEVYRFLREHTDFIQFLPVAERDGGGTLAAPPGIHTPPEVKPLLPFSLSGADWGGFLCSVFDEWARHDVGRKSIQLFEAVIGNMRRQNSGLCSHDAICGHCPVIEADGAVYACDRYADSRYKIGELDKERLAVILEQNRRFGLFKTLSLPPSCLQCEWVKVCFGGCPKDRFPAQGNRQAAVNHHCAGYRSIYRKIRDFLNSR